MKLFDFIKRKISKVPLVGSSKVKLLSLFSGGSSKNNGNYYNGWIYLAVSTIAQEVAGIKLKLFKKDSKGNVEQVFDHPSIKVLSHANDYMTQYDIFERLQSNQELQGNEYWFITYLNNQPSSIYPLPPESVTPIRGKFEYVKGYIYKVDGETINIPVKNILQFKQFNPMSDIIGMSTLEAAKVAAQTDTFSKKYNLKYFQNDARPDVILEFEDALDPEAEKRLLEKWNQNHSGPDKQFKTAVASGGLKINSFQIAHRDMEYLEGRKFTRDEIMAIFRVPLTVAGLTGNETYASAKAADYAFSKRTITPKMTRIINVLNEHYLKLFPDTEGMYFEFESPVAEDRDMVLRGYTSGIKDGWMSINDVRRAEDLPEIEGGESVMIPFNVQPLGEPKAKSVSEGPVKKGFKSIMDNAFEKLKTEQKEEEIPSNPNFQGMTKEQIDRFEQKGEMIHKEKDVRSKDYEKQFQAVLDELWEGQKKRAIENLNTALKRKDWKAKATELIDKQKEVKITVDLLTPLMLSLTEEEAKAAYAYLGIANEEPLTRDLVKFVAANTKLLAGEMTDVTTKKIRAEIAAGLEASETIPELTKRVQESSAFSKSRSINIARTETARAQGESAVEVWKEIDVVKAKTWYTAIDERVCSWCGPMHGKKIGLDDSFFKKGDKFEGSDGTVLKLDYDDVVSEPLHPQCRCTLLPEV